VLAGWQVSGILTAQTSEPVTIIRSGTPPSRPDYIGGKAIRDDYNRAAGYINKAAFNRVPLGAGGNPIRPGTIGSGALRGPGFWSVDFSFGKNFSITKRVGSQLRSDMFNVVNHTPFQGFTASINSANFGKFTSQRGLGKFSSRALDLENRSSLSWAAGRKTVGEPFVTLRRPGTGSTLGTKR
jgi:hypothetical protein